MRDPTKCDNSCVQPKWLRLFFIQQSDVLVEVHRGFSGLLCNLDNVWIHLWICQVDTSYHTPSFSTERGHLEVRGEVRNGDVNVHEMFIHILHWMMMFIHHYTHRQHGTMLYRGRASHVLEGIWAKMATVHGYGHFGRVGTIMGTTLTIMIFSFVIVTFSSFHEGSHFYQSLMVGVRNRSLHNSWALQTNIKWDCHVIYLPCLFTFQSWLP